MPPRVSFLLHRGDLHASYFLSNFSYVSWCVTFSYQCSYGPYFITSSSFILSLEVKQLDALLRQRRREPGKIPENSNSQLYVKALTLETPSENVQHRKPEHISDDAFLTSLYGSASRYY